MFYSIKTRSYQRLFPLFPLFFPRKTGKAGKTGNISKVWEFNRGQSVWKASHSNIWMKKLENMKIQKIARKKQVET